MNNSDRKEMQIIINEAKKMPCLLCGGEGHALICWPPKHGPLFGVKSGHTVCCVLCERCNGKNITTGQLENYLLTYDAKPLDPAGLLDAQLQKRGSN